MICKRGVGIYVIMGSQAGIIGKGTAALRAQNGNNKEKYYSSRRLQKTGDTKT